jgi:hypothetical protein
MFFAEFAEDKVRAYVGKIEELLGSVTELLEEPFTGFHAEDEESEGELKTESPKHGL